MLDARVCMVAPRPPVQLTTGSRSFTSSSRGRPVSKRQNLIAVLACPIDAHSLFLPLFLCLPSNKSPQKLGQKLYPRAPNCVRLTCQPFHPKPSQARTYWSQEGTVSSWPNCPFWPSACCSSSLLLSVRLSGTKIKSEPATGLTSVSLCVCPSASG